ncbi:ABC transporter ATP-binding protein [Nocardioides piscis]|uniref:ATP-binding cassette domain-containing protein n=1 Tax=Nocardioides piscis TaxID=2714938 RepID=A0A6G7YJZ3_9ACTN|nr:ABC transporter ATP-binding protein [Nocardioides piscis]QIK77055.1 ATP-binding cassette domain-containing protein [Nocardioides piscis]
MIELRDIHFTYDERPVLGGVDLTLEEGELVLVSGRTGVGKSTLLGVLTGLVPRFSGGTLRGDILLDGVSVIDQPPRERAHVVGYVGQDPVAGFVTDTVEEELAYGMEQLGLPGDTMRRRVEETLDLLGIADLRHRDLRALSGGQQQRVAIGSVITTHPRLLVLDEPTSALDPSAAEDVLATLTRLVHDLGLTVLLAEHRLERVVPFADRMCLLGGDGTLLVGSTPDVLAVSPVVPPIIGLGRAAGWSPLPLSVRDARRAARSLDLDVPTTPVPEEGETLLSARGLTVAHGRVPVLDGVDLELRSGRVTALMGRNGAGKSTLIWTLQGTRTRRSGSVSVTGSDPARLDAAARRALVGLVPQTAADLLYLESVDDECAAADAGAGSPAGTCRDLLERLVPGVEGKTHPRDLSEGQRLALVLAIVLTARPRVLLLDEPTRGLDYPAKAALAAIVTDLAAQGHAVLIATHDVEFVAGVADDVVVLAEGEVVSAGPVREVLVASPSYAPQVTKILGPPWLRVGEVEAALRRHADGAGA